MSSPTSTEVSPSPSPVNTNNAPKYGTLVPNRIFVGGISANTTETELHALFSTYGNVKATKIISDRAGVSKGYGFVTFETEEEAKRIQKEADNIVLKDRKLNIAPAIKKQQPFTRSYGDLLEINPTLSPNGQILYHNGMPYTYQNGMAFFTSPDGSYSFPQAQPPYPMLYPQPVYLPQQQYQYQAQSAQPQWAGNQWQWGPMLSLGQPDHHSTQYMYSHNSAAPPVPALTASHAGDTFTFVDPAATHSSYQQSSDLADVTVLEDLEVNPAEDRSHVPEPRSQMLPNNTRSGPLPDMSSNSTDFNVLPFDQGAKSLKKSGSPRKLYSLFSTARLQQHRQKFFSKHLNGVHFLNYPQSENSDDLLHPAETGGMRSLGSSLTPPRTLTPRPTSLDVRNSPIMESTRKLQALGL